MHLAFDQRGAGLLILLLVLLGLGLTAGVLTVSVRLAMDEQATAETQRKMRRLAEVVSASNFSSGSVVSRHYEQDVGKLPSGLNDLLSRPGAVGTCFVTTASQNMAGWCGPYWTGQFVGEDPFSDGWGNPLILSTNPRHIRSRGPNGVDNNGGGDDLVQPY